MKGKQFFESHMKYFLKISGLNFKKTTALITTVCFLLTGVFGQAISALTEEKAEERYDKQIFKEFILPSSMGRITEGKYFGSSKVVINIQDMHCHSEVQKNISDILSVLDEKFNLSCVYLEGAAGEVDMSWLTSIKNKEIKQQVVDSLLSKGELTGVEYYAVHSQKGFAIRGLENEQLYKENSLRLDKINKGRASAEGLLKFAGMSLEKVKNLYFNTRQKNLEKLITKHRQGKLDSVKYYKALEKYAGNMNIDIYGYKNLSAYLQLLDLQKKMDYKKVTRQLEKVVGLLKQRIPYSVYKSLLQRTNNFSKLDELYIYLAKMVKQYDIELNNEFPELGKFFNYVNKSQEINPLKLIFEENRLIREINFGLSKNKSQREVVFMLDFYRHFEDFVNNKISAQDYDYFSTNLSEFELLYRCYTNDETLSDLDSYFKVLNEFYQVNIERNKWFVKNILENVVADSSAISNNKISSPPLAKGGEGGFVSYVNDVERIINSLQNTKDIKVVVTGGFHTPGLEKLLSEQNISYLVITPNVTQESKSAELKYSELIKEQNIIFSQAFGPWVAQALDIKAERLVGSRLPMYVDQYNAGNALSEILNKSNMGKEKVEQAVNDFLKTCGPELSGVIFKIYDVVNEGEEKGNFKFSLHLKDSVRNYQYDAKEKTTRLIGETKGAQSDQAKVKDKKKLTKDEHARNSVIGIMLAVAMMILGSIYFLSNPGAGMSIEQLLVDNPLAIGLVIFAAVSHYFGIRFVPVSGFPYLYPSDKHTKAGADLVIKNKSLLSNLRTGELRKIVLSIWDYVSVSEDGVMSFDMNEGKSILHNHKKINDNRSIATIKYIFGDYEVILEKTLDERWFKIVGIIKSPKTSLTNNQLESFVRSINQFGTAGKTEPDSLVYLKTNGKEIGRKLYTLLVKDNNDINRIQNWLDNKCKMGSINKPIRVVSKDKESVTFSINAKNFVYIAKNRIDETVEVIDIGYLYAFPHLVDLERVHYKYRGYNQGYSIEDMMKPAANNLSQWLNQGIDPKGIEFQVNNYLKEHCRIWDLKPMVFKIVDKNVEDDKAEIDVKFSVTYENKVWEYVRYENGEISYKMKTLEPKDSSKKPINLKFLIPFASLVFIALLANVGISADPAAAMTGVGQQITPLTAVGYGLGFVAIITFFILYLFRPDIVINFINRFLPEKRHSNFYYDMQQRRLLDFIVEKFSETDILAKYKNHEVTLKDLINKDISTKRWDGLKEIKFDIPEHGLNIQTNPDKDYAIEKGTIKFIITAKTKDNRSIKYTYEYDFKAGEVKKISALSAAEENPSVVDEKLAVPTVQTVDTQQIESAKEPGIKDIEDGLESTVPIKDQEKIKYLERKMLAKDSNDDEIIKVAEKIMRDVVDDEYAALRLKALEIATPIILKGLPRDKYGKLIRKHEDEIDMHKHTTNSDGDYPPEYRLYVDLQSGYRDVAITDHDDVPLEEVAASENVINKAIDNYNAGRKESWKIPKLNVYPGVEIHVEYDEVEVHLVVLLKDYFTGHLYEKQELQGFINKFNKLNSLRESAVLKVLEKSKDVLTDYKVGEETVNLSITAEDVKKIRRTRFLYSATLAQTVFELYKKQYKKIFEKLGIKSANDVYKKIFKKNKLGTGELNIITKADYFTLEEALQFVRVTNGKFFIAHPPEIFENEENAKKSHTLERIIEKEIPDRICGKDSNSILDESFLGIEFYGPKMNDPATQKRLDDYIGKLETTHNFYKERAKRRKILRMTGTDDHGAFTSNIGDYTYSPDKITYRDEIISAIQEKKENIQQQNQPEENILGSEKNTLGFIDKILRGLKFTIVADEKSFNEYQKEIKLAKDLKNTLTSINMSDINIILLPKYTSLKEIVSELSGSKIIVGAQDGYEEGFGGAVGEIPFEELKGLGVTHVVVGHPWVRQNRNEDNEMVSKKLKKALEVGLSPILCVGEEKQHYEADITDAEKGYTGTKNFIREQVTTALNGLNGEQISKIIFAYAPAWVTSEKPASPDYAEYMHKFIRSLINDKLVELKSGIDAKNITIVCAGGVTEENVVKFAKKPNINGFLIGGASKKIESLSKIIQNLGDFIVRAIKDAEKFAELTLKAADSKIAKKIVEGRVLPPLYKMLEGTGMQGKSYLGVYDKIDEEVKSKLRTLTNLGMNAIAISVETRINPDEKDFIKNIIVPIYGEKIVVPVYAERVSAENGNSAAILRIYCPREKLEELTRNKLNTSFRELEKWEEDGKLYQHAKMQLLGFGAQAIISKINEDNVFCEKLQELGLPFQQIDIKILDIKGRAGILTLVNQDNLANEIESTRNIGYLPYKNEVAVSYSWNDFEPETPNEIEMISYTYNPNYWVRIIESADKFGKTGRDIAIDDSIVTPAINNEMYLRGKKLGGVSDLELETAEKIMMFRSVLLAKKNNSVMRPKSGVGFKFRISQLNEQPGAGLRRGTFTDLEKYIKKINTQGIPIQWIELTDVVDSSDEKHKLNMRNTDLRIDDRMPSGSHT